MVGEKIDNYRILEQIGQGGMGRVYKAFDETLERYVALKMLNPEALSKKHFAEKFKREAKSQAKLSHPNIVALYGFVQRDDVLAIVMEYVEGISLEKMLGQNKPLGILDVIYIMHQILSALSFAHSRGFLHRDIKPSNIIYDSGQKIAKIMDFGIARAMDEENDETHQAGTAMYMSPEQIKDLPVGPQTDIYSLGATFYELLTGRPPFTGRDDQEIMDAQINDQIPVPSEIVRSLPPEADLIVQRAMSKDAAGRFSDCMEFDQQISSLERKLMQQRKTIMIRAQAEDKRMKRMSTGMFIFVAIAFAALLYFSFYEVRSLMQGGGLQGLADYSISRNNRLSISVKNIHYSVFRTGGGEELKSISSAAGLSAALTQGGFLFISEDDGLNWKKGPVKYPAEFNSVSMLDDGSLIAAGSSPYIYKSQNVFTAGQRLSLRSEMRATCTFFLNRNIGFAAGTRGIILKTNDGGKNWKETGSPSGNCILDVSFMNPGTGFACGFGGLVLMTKDGGEHWMRLSSPDKSVIKTVCFKDALMGAASTGTELYVTKDGGTIWQRTEIDGFTVKKIRYFNEYGWCIIGSSGTVLFSKDLQDFVKPARQIDEGLNDLCLSRSGKIFIAGFNGTILKF